MEARREEEHKETVRKKKKTLKLKTSQHGRDYSSEVEGLPIVYKVPGSIPPHHY